MSNISDVKHSRSYSCWSFSAFFRAASKSGALFGQTTNYPEVPLDKQHPKNSWFRAFKDELAQLNVYPSLLYYILPEFVTDNRTKKVVYVQKKSWDVFLFAYFEQYLWTCTHRDNMNETDLCFSNVLKNKQKEFPSEYVQQRCNPRRGTHVSRIGQMGINGSPGGERTKTTTKHKKVWDW